MIKRVVCVVPDGTKSIQNRKKRLEVSTLAREHMPLNTEDGYEVECRGEMDGSCQQSHRSNHSFSQKNTTKASDEWWMMCALVLVSDGQFLSGNLYLN